jgi:lipoprotein-releasing system permease protein
MALVVVLSGFNGISNLVMGLYNTFDPDIKITIKEGKTFTPDSASFSKIKKINGVVFYTEVLQENALLKYGDKQMIATIKGVSDDFKNMTRIDTVIKEGEFLLESKVAASNDNADTTLAIQPINNVVIGYGIAHKLNIAVSNFTKPLELYVPKRGNQAYLNPQDAFTIRTTEIAGIFSLNDDFDYKYCITSLSLAKALLHQNQLSAIEIGIEKGEDVIPIKKEIESILGNTFSVKTRFEQNEVLFKTINSEKWWTFLILGFILIIATFNVIGSIIMLIIEKKKDIKILQFLGADNALIRSIFLRQGLIITLTGALSGIVLGLLVCWIQMQFKIIPFSEGFVVDFYPIKVMPGDLIMVFITVLVIGLVAAWYPVRVFTTINS